MCHAYRDLFPLSASCGGRGFSRQLVAVYGHKHVFPREEWRLPFLLKDAGSLDSLRLSQRTLPDKVQVSRAASRPEEKGLITHSVLGSERRSRNHAITDAGRDLFSRAFGAVETRANQILNAMSAADRGALAQGIAEVDRSGSGAASPSSRLGQMQQTG
ncbi:MarR family transcriptional regulator [Paracoccus kondratievae]|nr:MarR family transcriptional regulator [Paracoccus kondratievae]